MAKFVHIINLTYIRGPSDRFYNLDTISWFDIMPILAWHDDEDKPDGCSHCIRLGFKDDTHQWSGYITQSEYFILMDRSSHV